MVQIEKSHTHYNQLLFKIHCDQQYSLLRRDKGNDTRPVRIQAPFTVQQNQPTLSVECQLYCLLLSSRINDVVSWSHDLRPACFHNVFYPFLCPPCKLLLVYNLTRSDRLETVTFPLVIEKFLKMKKTSRHGLFKVCESVNYASLFQRTVKESVAVIEWLQLKGTG